MYADRPSSTPLVDRWNEGISWIAHPSEEGLRASHAIRGEDDGVWIVDPLEAVRR